MDHLIRFKLDLAISPDAAGERKKRVLWLGLFANLTNCEQVVKQLKEGEDKEGSTRGCLVNSSLILDETQLLVAANKAVYAKNEGKMKTRNIYSEMLYCLSPSRSIPEAFKKFSAKATDKSVVALALSDDSKTEPELFTLLSGERVAFNQLKERFSDVDQIKKVINVKMKLRSRTSSSPGSPPKSYSGDRFE